MAVSKLYGATVAILGICACSTILGAMESKDLKQTKYFHLRRADGVERDIPLGVPFTSAAAGCYARGLQLVHKVSQQCVDVPLAVEQDRSSMQEQRERLGGLKDLNSGVMRIACDLYAQTLIGQATLQSLLKSGPTASQALENLPAPIEACITKKLYALCGHSIDNLIGRTDSKVMRLCTLAMQQEKRRDGFLVLPSTGRPDTLYVKREFEEALYSDTSKFLFPWVLKYQGKDCLHVLDQVRLAESVDKAQGSSQHSSHDLQARAFKMSADGTWLFGFCGTCGCDIGAMVCFERNAVGLFEFRKAIKIVQGVLTRHYPVVMQDVGHAGIGLEGMVYDIQPAFALHPYENKAAYIDSRHALYHIDFAKKTTMLIMKSAYAQAASWSPDGCALAWVTSNGKLYMCSAPYGRDMRHWSYIPAWKNLQWSYDGSKLLLVAPDAVCLVNAVNGGIIAQFDVADREQKIVSAVLSDDSHKLVMVTTDNMMTLWDVASHAQETAFPCGFANVLHMAISPSMKYVGICCESQGAIVNYLWDIDTRTLVMYDDAQMLEFGIKLQDGFVPIEHISLSQMILFLAAAQAKDKVNIRGNHYLVAQFRQLAPYLRKYLESKLVV